MRNRLMGTIADAFFATSMIALPALAQYKYSDWNTNNDLYIDRTEFNTGLERHGLFNKWDANDDGVLAENEWRTGIGDRMTLWDSRFGTSSWNDWNTDNAAGPSGSEFNTGLFGGYDENRSGYIEEPEFGDVGDDMGDGGLFDI